MLLCQLGARFTISISSPIILKFIPLCLLFVKCLAMGGAIELKLYNFSSVFYFVKQIAIQNPNGSLDQFIRLG